MSVKKTLETEMATTNAADPSIARLEHEAAGNRAALMHTVTVLQDRIAPSAIKRDVQEYIQEKKANAFRTIEQTARENPLQTVAVAAAAAYPLWRIASRVPIPLLLIGAGIALTRRQGPAPGGGVQGWMHEASQRLGEATDAAREKAGDFAARVQDQVQSTTQAARQTAEQLADGLSGLKDRAAEAADRASGRIDESLRDSSHTAANAKERISDGLASSLEAVSDAGAAVRDRVAQAGTATQNSIVDAIERHPILVGAIGLGIGAVLAAAIPSTRQEGELFGDLSDSVTRKARDIAAEGLSTAKQVAGEVYRETLQNAEEQGLSADGIKDAATDIGEKFKSVVAKATEDFGGKKDAAASPSNRNNG